MTNLKKGKIPLGKAIRELKGLPYKDLGFAKVDSHRALRCGFPEVIFGKGKTGDEIVKIAKNIISRNGVLLITHVDGDVYLKLKKSYPGMRYERRARLIYYKRRNLQNNRDLQKKSKKGKVLIITGGTADLPVAIEAKITLELMGQEAQTLYDVGVAGVHRLLDKIDVITRASVIIVVAGMEGALASVVSGLVSKPVIAVPTSVGYGASFEGLAPLLTMLNACSPGVAVVNIDNGFGAGYFASMINK